MIPAPIPCLVCTPSPPARGSGAFDAVAPRVTVGVAASGTVLRCDPEQIGPGRGVRLFHRPPTVGRPHVPSYDMAGTRPLTDSELTALHSALHNAPPRDAALMRLMLNLGFRISEMLALDVADVWHAGEIRPRVRLNRARLKGGAGPWRRSVASRTVILNEAARAALEEFVFSRFGSTGPSDADAAGPLFRSRKGGRLSLWAANRTIARIMASAGIAGQNPGEISSHALRKTFCTKVYQASGKDILVVRAAMNHRHLTTTQAYLSVDGEAVERAVLAIGASAVAAPINRQDPELAIFAGHLRR